MNTIIQKKLVYPLIQKFIHENVLEQVPIIENFQYLSANEIRERQWEKLEDMIHHAYNTTSYYKNLFNKLNIKPSHFQDFEDLKKLPILSKEEVDNNYENLVSSKISKYTTKTISSGTNKPIRIIRDNYATSLDRAIKGRCLKWFDCEIGDKEARLWGSPFTLIDKLAKKSQDYFLNRIRLTPFDLSEETIEMHYKKLKSFNPKILYGYVSALYKMASIAENNDILLSDLDLKVIITTAEVLNKFQRDNIENAFKTHVSNEYGCSEMGFIAFDCKKKKMHIMEDSVYLEIEKEKDISLNNTGDIILTDLKNKAFPLLRYRIGDIGSISNDTCSCNVNFAHLKEVHGRSEELILGSNNKYIVGAVFTYLIGEYYNCFADFRVIQHKDRSVSFNYIKNSIMDNSILSVLDKRFHKILGNDIEVKFNEVNELPPESSGKRRYVISEALNND